MAISCKGFLMSCALCRSSLIGPCQALPAGLFGVLKAGAQHSAPAVPLESSFAAPLHCKSVGTDCRYRGLYFAAIRDGARHWAWFFLHMLANLVWDW